jgi:hypothetical protein
MVSPRLPSFVASDLLSSLLLPSHDARPLDPGLGVATMRLPGTAQPPGRRIRKRADPGGSGAERLRFLPVWLRSLRKQR